MIKSTQDLFIKEMLINFSHEHLRMITNYYEINEFTKIKNTFNQFINHLNNEFIIDIYSNVKKIIIDCKIY